MRWVPAYCGLALETALRAATALGLCLCDDFAIPHDTDIDALVTRKAASATGQCRRLEVASFTRSCVEGTGMYLLENEAGPLIERHCRLARVDSFDATSQLLQFGDGGLVVDAQTLRQMRCLSALHAVFLLAVFVGHNVELLLVSLVSFD
jgi:hypothetical protein